MSRPLPPSRFRRVAKWVGVGLCVAILLVWGLNLRWQLKSRCQNFHLFQGSMIVRLGHGSFDLDVAKWHTWSAVGYPLFDLNMPSIRRHHIFSTTGSFFTTVSIPLWTILLCIAVPTARAFWTGRRRPVPGYCVKCGYDLRASKDRCPECNTPITAEPPE